MKKNVLSIDWTIDFHCIGGECPLSCCSEWNIIITPEEVSKYKELAKHHPFGENILEAIDEERCVMKLCDGRCMLLTEDNWCKLVLECGEEYLSGTCTTFPRVSNQFGDIIEYYVEIGCPHVAKNIFGNNKIGFAFGETDDPSIKTQEQKLDLQLYDTLSMARTYLIDLFQSYNATYSLTKSYILFSTIRQLQEIYKNHQMSRNRVRQWMERWDYRNCASVFDALETITKRMDLRVVKILELLNKLLSSKVLDYLLTFAKDNTLKEDYYCWVQDNRQFEEELQRFTDYFAEHYSLAFENYFVYVLFSHWIPKGLQMAQFGKIFFMRAISWCIIQLCALSIWKRKGTVSVEEYSLIVCGMERQCAHNTYFFEQMAEILETEDSIATILLYLIC